MPKIERLEQNTSEWLRWRLQGIGSSDAPVIMGEAAFKTRRLLWAIKTGRARDFAGNPASRRGHALERAARSAYEREFRVQMEPLCLVHDELEWMRASLDGLSFDGSTVLEIKCPLSLRDSNAAQQGRVPSHYYGQLQHQLEVSRAEEAHYWSFDGRLGRLVRIRPDRDYMKRLVDEEGEFWRRVKENRWPELDDKEVDLSSDPRWRSVAAVPSGQGSPGCGDRAGAQAESHSGPHGNRSAHFRMWGGGPEEFSQGHGRLRGDPTTFRSGPRDVPQASGRSDQDQRDRSVTCGVAVLIFG